jgi:hypothetical protein
MYIYIFIHIYINIYVYICICLYIGYIAASGPNSVSEFNVYNCLGILYKVKNEFTKAKEMYDKAMKGRQELLGDELCTFDM